MKFCDPLRQEHISVLGPIFGFPLRLAWFLLSNALHGNLFKPGIFKAGKTGSKLYPRHCKIRDRSVISNVYLNHK